MIHIGAPKLGKEFDSWKKLPETGELSRRVAIITESALQALFRACESSSDPEVMSAYALYVQYKGLAEELCNKTGVDDEPE